MVPPNEITISAAVEGYLDEVVVIRLILFVGAKSGRIHVDYGRPNVLRKIDAYNLAAEDSPWLVLVDLDDDDCAPALRESWLTHPSAKMCFRVAVHEIEAWLLADKERIAKFLSVRRAYVPENCESLMDPKATLVSLAANSHRTVIREDIIPAEGSSRTEGPGYTSRMAEFVREVWRPAVAAKGCDSLARALSSLESLKGDS